MRPSVSVVIPAYNCADVISRAIESAWNQVEPPHEVIVVDDCSEDGAELEAVLEPMLQAGRVSLLRTPRNSGPATARNIGVRASSAEFIALLDADDRYERDHLRLALEAFRQYPDTALTCTDAYVEQGGEVSPELKNDRLRPIMPIVTYERLLEGNCIHTVTVVFRRELFETLGPFDEHASLIGVEDYDMWLRVAKQRIIRYLDQPLCCYSITPGSVSGDPRRLFQGVFAVFDKLERDSEGLHEHHAAVLERRRREMRFDLAYNLCAIGDFAGARAAAWSAIGRYPLHGKPYRMLLKALLRLR